MTKDKELSKKELDAIRDKHRKELADCLAGKHNKWKPVEVIAGLMECPKCGNRWYK